jgi:hypothetical protein
MITLVVEVIGVCFVLARAWLSKVPEIRVQKYHMIAFCSVLLVELVEVLLWMEPEDLQSIGDASRSTCSARNTWLTRILYPNICLQGYIHTFVMSADNDPHVDKG